MMESSGGMGAILEALKAARHELTTLHGLTASDGPGSWTVDTQAVIATLDAAIAEVATQAELLDALRGVYWLHKKSCECLLDDCPHERAERLLS